MLNGKVCLDDKQLICRYVWPRHGGCKASLIQGATKCLSRMLSFV